MGIQGLRTTLNFVANQRPQNWREGILLRYPNGRAPLTALTAAMKSRVTDDPDFNWWEKELNNRTLILTASIATVNQTILTVAAAGTTSGGQTAVTGAFALKQGDLLYSPQTKEIMRVSADPTSDTSIQVIRGWSGSTATTLTYNASGINPNLYVIGSSFEENSSAPTGISFDPTKMINYTQIFRNTLEASRTALKTRLRTGDQAKEAKRETLELHSVDMERAFFWGSPMETTYNGKPIRTTGGLDYWINTYASQNAFSINGTMSWGTLEADIAQIFLYGSSEKMVFCGNAFLQAVQRIIRGAVGAHITFAVNVEEFGMRVMRLDTAFGSLVLKTHPLFNQMLNSTNSSGSNPAFNNLNQCAYVLDMENIRYVYFNGADTQYQPDLQVNGVDGLKSGFLTECGLEIDHAKTHAVFYNVTGGVNET